jgi:hypothetical protein
MSTKVDIVERQPRRRKRNKNKNKVKFTKFNELSRVNALANGRQALKMMGLKPKSQINRNKRRIRNNNGFFPGGNKQGQNFRSGKTSNENDMEYIGEVISNSTGFSVLNSYSVNPGQATVFPWLSKKALLYEKYQFRSLEFVYKPEVSGFASLGTTGKVILSFDYDASDAPPTTKLQMEDTDPSADDMPYKEICLKMKPRELHKNSDAKFVRPAGLPGGSDIKTFDCGILNVAISGIEANAGTLGELWVRYNCVLSVPVLESTASAPMNFSVSEFVSDAGETLTTATLHTILFAETTVVDGYANGIGAVNTSGSIVPPPGNYFVSWNVNFATTGNSTSFSAQLQKNGGNVLGNTNGVFTNPSGAYPTFPISGSSYVSCNGTDALKIVVEAYFSTGACTLNGCSIIIVAI